MARRQFFGRSAGQATVDPLPIAVVTEVVNAWSHSVRANGPVGRQSPSVGVDLKALWALVASDCGDAALAEIADQLYPLFAASTDAERAQCLNDLLLCASVTPAVCAESSSLRQVWMCTRTDRRLLAALVLALLEFVRHFGALERLGICFDEQCAQVFVDQSADARRRYCSVKCQNRASARTYRARRRTEQVCV